MGFGQWRYCDQEGQEEEGGCGSGRGHQRRGRWGEWEDIGNACSVLQEQRESNQGQAVQVEENEGKLPLTWN